MELVANPVKVEIESPPKEWFYYAYERILKNIKEKKIRPRPGSPYKTPEQLSRALTGWNWWFNITPGQRLKLLGMVKGERARGRVSVITSKGRISPAEVTKRIGRAAAKRVFDRLKVTKPEIEEARQWLKSPLRPSYRNLAVIKRAKAAPRKRPMNPRVKAAPRRRAANPSLMIVTNPGAKSVSIDAIKGLPGFEKARRKYKEFHGVEPREVRIIDLPDDVPVKENAVLVALGKSPEAVYHVPSHSRKQSKVPFKHEFRANVLKVTDPGGKLLMDISVGRGGYKVSDWIRG